MFYWSLIFLVLSALCALYWCGGIGYSPAAGILAPLFLLVGLILLTVAFGNRRGHDLRW